MARPTYDPQSLLVGVIGKPHGLDGEMTLRAYNPHGADLAKVSELIFERGQARDTRRLRTARRRADGWLVRVEGVDSRDAAAALTHTPVRVLKQALPALRPGEFFVEDLLGCEVRTVDGDVLGVVDTTFWNGAHDVMSVQQTAPQGENAGEGEGGRALTWRRTSHSANGRSKHLMPAGRQRCLHTVDAAAVALSRRWCRVRERARGRHVTAPGPAVTFEVITLFPELFDGFLRTSLLGKALTAGIIAVERTSQRDFATDRHRSVDDTPCGGGPGMILSAPPLAAALDDIQARRGPAHKILLSPRGRLLDQDHVRRLSTLPRIALVCGRYEGFDERVGALCDEELSIGDYVLAGGELAAAVVIEAVARLVPGVLGSGLSASDESFTSRERLEYPQWTRPLEFRGQVVPSSPAVR